MVKKCLEFEQSFCPDMMSGSQWYASLDVSGLESLTFSPSVFLLRARGTEERNLVLKKKSSFSKLKN